MPTRYAALSRWPARLVLVVTLALIGLGQLPAREVPAASSAAAKPRDADLYRAVAARVAAGEGYYPAVAAEQRAMGYPLKPFVTVRPPLLATATAAMGGPAAIERALQLAVLLTIAALVVRLRSVTGGGARVAALILAIASPAVLLQPGVAIWHEAWAGVLVAFALAVHRPERWWPSVIVALVAALLRELAIPFLLVMMAAALIERRRAEALGWIAALLVAGAVLALHATNVAAVALPTDRVSQGWAGGGWPTVIAMLGDSSVFTFLPPALIALVVPLALLGWAGLRSSLGLRGACWTGGMIAAFAIVGRPDNFYWGLLIAPLLPIGLAFAPAAVRDLVRRAGLGVARRGKAM